MCARAQRSRDWHGGTRCRALRRSAGAKVSVVQQPGDEPEDELSSPEAISGPTVLRILLGGQLRKLREAAGHHA